MKRLVIFLEILTIFLTNCSAADPIVEIDNGKIRGRNRGHYYSFESIPYAEPPTGINRFESPIPFTDKYDNGILDATVPHGECMQWSQVKFEGDLTDGSEDCLHLGVYTPEFGSDKLLPVFFHIHGGAFMFGSSLGFGNEERIMKDKNAIVVLANYRVGPLGFLSTNDDQIAGNMGLKDQQLALKWVKKNIRAFGGDPEKVIITGFSAGGASVHLHSLKKKTKNLASAAVSFSGTALCPWVMVNNPLERAKKLSSSLDCPTDNTTDMKNCLKQKDAENIVAAVRHFLKFQYNPFRVFGPVVESKAVKDAFLTDHPEKLMKKGHSADIPWITTWTAEDGGYNAAEMLRYNDNGIEYFEEFLEKFDELAPVALFYDETLDENQIKQYTKFLKEKYKIEESKNNMEKYYKIQQIFSDELFIKDAKRTITIHKDHMKSPIFGWFYDNPAPIGIGTLLSERTDVDFGTVHGDDVFLIYHLSVRDKFPLRSDEKSISKKLVDMLRNFISSNKPKFGKTPMPENKAGAKQIKYLKITKDDATVVSEDKMEDSKYDFFQTIRDEL